ncbi:hypothetical protein D9756_005974 [Leucocoprinus leucothites]|uniref:Uncharacterized protein n=1 Tax=Leucocoprinus leucothites TaxID=201217 RepID=A0A8H5D2X6_9AGAR|nr:hypothetical protein D9756_005974 [Leucoagaricus leucothites]
MSSPSFAHLQPVFLALHIAGGQVGLPLVIATLLLFKKVARHPTLINFFCIWVIYSVIFCLFLYSGQQDQQQPSNLCQVQSALIHGAPPMSVVATLVLVIQLWSTLREPPAQQITLSRSRWPSTLRLRIMLAIPYIIFAIFIAITAPLQRGENVQIGAWNGLYCTIRGAPIIDYAVPAFCTAVLVIIVGFEVAIAIRYFRMQRTISDNFPLADTKKSPAMVLRVLAFSVYTLITLSVGVLFLSRIAWAWPYMVQAGLPLFAFLVFGTQKDIFLAWRFWKPYPNVPPFDLSPKHPSSHPLPQRISSFSTDTSTIFGIERIPTLSISNV